MAKLGLDLQLRQYSPQFNYLYFFFEISRSESGFGKMIQYALVFFVTIIIVAISFTFYFTLPRNLNNEPPRVLISKFVNSRKSVGGICPNLS